MKQSIRISLYALVIILCIAGIFYAHTKVRSLWENVALRQALLQDVPARTTYTANLKKEFDATLVKMENIRATVPSSDGLVEVVSAISAAAVTSGISAQVPIVQENVPETEDGATAFSDVRIHVVASGSPAALASFLHRVEHLPYLLRVVSWKIDTTQQSAITSFTSAAPTDTPQVTSLRGSSFEADIAIVTRKEGAVP